MSLTSLIPGFSQAKLILAGVALASLIGGGLYLRHTWISQGEAAGNARAEAALAQRDAAISALRASQEASRGYHEELDALRNAGRPDPVIRVCPRPSPVQVPGPTARTDVPAAPAGELPASPGSDRDIGPALAREADRADRLAAQLRALQDWINGVRQ